MVGKHLSLGQVKQRSFLILLLWCLFHNTMEIHFFTICHIRQCLANGPFPAIPELPASSWFTFSKLQQPLVICKVHIWQQILMHIYGTNVTFAHVNTFIFWHVYGCKRDLRYLVKNNVFYKKYFKENILLKEFNLVELSHMNPRACSSASRNLQ